jgi:hypothetical protein
MSRSAQLTDPSSAAARQLRLVREARIADLLPDGAPDRLEASGVLALGGRFHVIFDNLRCVAMIHEELHRVGGSAVIPTTPDARSGYEDIARDPVTGHTFLLIEAERRKGRYLARVEEYDEELRFLSGSWLKFPLPGPNKGIEGLECVRRDGTLYLLGLCEGNRNRNGAAGRKPGGGRIVVFRRGRKNWKHHTTIDLPRTLDFADYSALSIAGGRVAVVSQETSALWSTSLASDAWELAGAGRTYLFPRDADGEIVYCTVEGVCWLGASAVVAVSDRAKARARGGRGRAKDESVHVFALPEGTGGDRRDGLA